MSKDENDLQKRYLMRKIKRLRPFFDGLLCYHTHCQWKIGGRNACCLPRCLRRLKYKGRDEKNVQLLQCSDLPQNKAIY